MQDINIYKNFLSILTVISITQIIINLVSKSNLYDNLSSVIFFSVFLTIVTMAYSRGKKNEKIA